MLKKNKKKNHRRLFLSLTFQEILLTRNQRFGRFSIDYTLEPILLVSIVAKASFVFVDAHLVPLDTYSRTQIKGICLKSISHFANKKNDFTIYVCK